MPIRKFSKIPSEKVDGVANVGEFANVCYWMVPKPIKSYVSTYDFCPFLDDHLLVLYLTNDLI